MRGFLLAAAALGGLVIAGDICSDICESHPDIDQCASFLSTTLASTVVTATYTSTYTRFNNNKFNPTTIAAPVKSHKPDKSGIYTIVPTRVPDVIKYGACGAGLGPNDDEKLQSNFKCACSGAGYVAPSGQSQVLATATITIVELFPTTVSEFRMKALFDNGTDMFVIQDVDPKETLWDEPTFVKLVENTTYPAPFGFTPGSRLRLESQGKLSFILPNIDDPNLPVPLRFINDTTGVTFRPMAFHISDIHTGSNASSIFSISISPYSGSATDYRIPDVSTSNMTVILACDDSICIGTPAWQVDAFNAGSKVSKDGRYQLVDLHAIPVY